MSTEPKISTEPNYNKIGSAFVEQNGSFWKREEKTWEAYNLDGTVQGSGWGAGKDNQNHSFFTTRLGKFLFFEDGYDPERLSFRTDSPTNATAIAERVLASYPHSQDSIVTSFPGRLYRSLAIIPDKKVANHPSVNQSQIPYSEGTVLLFQVYGPFSNGRIFTLEPGPTANLETLTKALEEAQKSL